jgi:YHS domain-containing protein
MILRLVLTVIVIYVLYKLIRGWKAVKGSSQANLPARGEELVEDPCCNTYIPISDACRTSINGKAVYFCSQKCLEKYRAEKRT